MEGIKVYLPFKGGSIYGRGEVNLSNTKNSFYMFQNNTGTIYFNSCDDMQIKGIQRMLPLTDNDLHFNQE